MEKCHQNFDLYRYKGTHNLKSFTIYQILTSHIQVIDVYSSYKIVWVRKRGLWGWQEQMKPTYPRKVIRQTRRTRLGSHTSLDCNWLLGWTWAQSLTSGATGCQWTWGLPHRKAEGTQQDISVNCLDGAHNCLTYTGDTWPWLYLIWVYNFFAFDTFLPEPAESSRVLQSAVPSSCLGFLENFPLA